MQLGFTATVQSDACGHLACEGGVVGECNSDDGEWSNMKVTCNRAAAASSGVGFDDVVQSTSQSMPDGTTSTTVTNADGAVAVSIANADGTAGDPEVVAPITNADGSTTAILSDGTTTTTTDNGDGNSIVVDQLPDGSTVTTANSADGTSTDTITDADGAIVGGGADSDTAGTAAASQGTTSSGVPIDVSGPDGAAAGAILSDGSTITTYSLKEDKATTSVMMQSVTFSGANAGMLVRVAGGVSCLAVAAVLFVATAVRRRRQGYEPFLPTKH
jgi:hypothetical protein